MDPGAMRRFIGLTENVRVVTGSSEATPSICMNSHVRQFATGAPAGYNAPVSLANEELNALHGRALKGGICPHRFGAYSLQGQIDRIGASRRSPMLHAFRHGENLSRPQLYTLVRNSLQNATATQENAAALPGIVVG